MIISPIVSIIIPCYNQGSFLDETLQSVLNQTFSNWECIIVNDGSKDCTEDIAKSWCHKDGRFCYYLKENSGVSSTRNFGIEKLKGKYLQFLDADDVLDKDKLELSLNEFQQNTNNKVKVVISNFRMLAFNSKKLTDPYCRLNSELFNFDSLLYKWQETFSIPIHCGLFDAALFETIRFPESVTAQEDWIVWVQIFKKGCEAVFIDKPLAFYRINHNGRTMSESYLIDQIKTYELFKTILNDEEYQRFSMVLISRYYRAQEELKKRERAIKNSNPYQTGLMIKKVLKSVGLLTISRKLFPIFLKFKSK